MTNIRMTFPMKATPPNTKYTTASARSMIGQRVAVVMHGTTIGFGLVRAANVIDDGAAVLLTVDADTKDD